MKSPFSNLETRIVVSSALIWYQLAASFCRAGYLQHNTVVSLQAIYVKIERVLCSFFCNCCSLSLEKTPNDQIIFGTDNWNGVIIQWYPAEWTTGSQVIIDKE